MIPISVVAFDHEAERLVLEVVRSGHIAQGPMVEELEARFAELCGVRHAVAVNNGTTALVAALQVLGVGPGDEVVTSPFTFVATLNAILHVGATVRFADIDERDFCLRPDDVTAVITDRTKVVMPVHLYGQSADMGAIGDISTARGLAVVEDAAQAHGATFAGRRVGSFGLGAFSFYATKNLTTGEGGMLTTDDDDLADQLRVIRNQGMRARYQYETIGHNYRLTDLQAAVALPQLKGYERAVAQRRTNAALLSEGLSELPGIVVPHALPGREHVWHQYTILVGEDAPLSRDELAVELAARGIGSGVYYPRVAFDYDCYRRHPRVAARGVPVATAVARRCLSLPVHPHLSEADVEHILDAVRTVMKA